MNAPGHSSLDRLAGRRLRLLDAVVEELPDVLNGVRFRRVRGGLGIRAPEVRVSPLRQIAVQTRLSVMEDSLRAPRPTRVMFPIYAAALSILSGRACLWQTDAHLW